MAGRGESINFDFGTDRKPRKPDPPKPTQNAPRQTPRPPDQNATGAKHLIQNGAKNLVQNGAKNVVQSRERPKDVDRAPAEAPPTTFFPLEVMPAEPYLMFCFARACPEAFDKSFVNYLNNKVCGSKYVSSRIYDPAFQAEFGISSRDGMVVLSRRTVPFRDFYDFVTVALSRERYIRFHQFVYRMIHVEHAQQSAMPLVLIPFQNLFDFSGSSHTTCSRLTAEAIVHTWDVKHVDFNIPAALPDHIYGLLEQLAANPANGIFRFPD